MSKTITVTVNARTTKINSVAEDSFEVEATDFLNADGSIDDDALEASAREFMFDRIISWDFKTQVNEEKK